jgi:hypothetical protein
MRSVVNAVVYVCTALAVTAAFPVGARAAGPDVARPEAADSRSGQEAANRWVPSLALMGGVAVQQWEGAVASTFCPECTIPDPSMQAMRDANTGDDLNVSTFFGTSLALMTPELPIAGSPRLFLGGDLQFAFGTRRKVALEGDPGELESPLISQPNQPFVEEAVIGQGSETVAELDNLMYGLHAGISFPLTFMGKPLRIKPSVAWIRYGVSVDGLVVDAQCKPTPDGGTQCNADAVSPPPPFPPTPEGAVREVRLMDSDSEMFDGIGPGLDLEMDTGRYGPIGSSLFMSTRFYKILGDTTIGLSDSQLIPPDDVGPGGEAAARWLYEADDWMYQVGIGMRFQWLGSDR